MSEGKRKDYVAGYIGATPAEHLSLEKQTITEMHRDGEPDRWFIDMEGATAELRALIAEMGEGRVNRVVLRDRDMLPSSVPLIGEFFDTATATDTTVIFLDQATTPATEKLLSQMVVMLHEWRRGEDEHFAEQGWYTIHANRDDVRWLRGLLTQNNTEQARRWLERLLPDVGAEGWEKPADE